MDERYSFDNSRSKSGMNERDSSLLLLERTADEGAIH